MLHSSEEDRADLLAGTGFDDFIKAFDRLTVRWKAGRCAPALREKILGIVEDLREFGHL